MFREAHTPNYSKLLVIQESGILIKLAEVPDKMYHFCKVVPKEKNVALHVCSSATWWFFSYQFQCNQSPSLMQMPVQ
jgi:hypothetical protein